jgi:Bifunctional DNA primase/polymerase, N-terminal
MAVVDGARRPKRTPPRALGALFLAPGKTASAFKASAVSVLLSAQSFRDWQPLYADHRIATFPVRVSSEGKVPAIRGWQRVGLPGSSKLAQKFAGADALGFCPGLRSGLTILDVDTPDERVLADALDRYGQTRIIVRSGSGHFQAWYSHGGENRSIRPEPDIDILGGGFVVAPPSRGVKGDYQFIRGGLDDLDRLPIMRNIKIASPPLSPVSGTVEIIAQGRRNNELYRKSMKAAHTSNNLAGLIDTARTMSNFPRLCPTVR